MSRRTICTCLMIAGALAVGSTARAQSRPELLTQGGGSDFPGPVAFGGGGRWLIAADNPPISSYGQRHGPRTVRVFDVRTGRLTRTFSDVVSLAAHPNRDLLVLLTQGTVVAVNPLSGVESWRKRVERDIFSMQFSPDGESFVAMTISGARFGLFRNPRFKIELQRLGVVDGHQIARSSMESWVTGASAFSSDGEWAHSYLMRLNCKKAVDTCVTTTLLRSATGQTAAGRLSGAVVASHAGIKRVVTTPWLPNGQAEVPLTLRDAPSGRTVAVFNGLNAEFSRDGNVLLVTHARGWNLADSRTGAVVANSPPATPVAYWTLSADGLSVAGVQRGRLLVVDRRTQPLSVQVLGAGNGTPLLVETEPLAVPGRVADISPQMFFNLYGDSRASAAFTFDGEWLVASATDGMIDAWDVSSGAHLPFRVAAAHSAPSQARLIRRFVGTDPLFVGRSANKSDTLFAGTMALFAANGLYCSDAAQSLSTVAALYRLSFRHGENATTASELELSDVSGVVEEGQVGCAMDPDAKRTLMATSDVRIDDRDERATAYLLDRQGEHYTGSLSARFYWSQDGRFIVGVDRTQRLQDIRVWEAKDYKEVEVNDERLRVANLVGFVADSSAIVTSSKWPLQDGASIEIWDLQTMGLVVHADTIRMDSKLSGRIAAQNPHARGEPASNGRVVLNADDDGRLNISSFDGSRLGSLTVTRGGEWLVTTPDGLFDGSPAGWRQLSWRESAPSVVEPGELFFNEFYRPGLLARLLTGRAPAAPESVAAKDRRQPSLSLSGRLSRGRTATISLVVSEAPSTAERANGSGVRDVRLFRNGSLARIWRGPVSLTDGSARLEATVPVTAGENTFVAYAFNNDDVKSSDAELKISADLEPRRPVVYILAIGVNRYANHEFNLRYASSDASKFAEAVASAQKATRPDRDIRAISLLDEEATRANIFLAMARLSGASTGTLPDMAPRQLSRLGRSRPEDTVILYFAGHGMADGDRFFLVPTDIAYQGPRATVGEHLDDALRNGLSDLDLERALEPLDAQYLALIIDACQSGQAIGDDQQRFGPMNSRGLAQLAYEKGMDILAASQAYQAALESSELGQGLLTYSLTKEALSSGVADRRPLDGVVTLEEWCEYAVARVPELQRASIIRARENGRELRFESPRDGHAAELQVPRLFSPRDRGYPPLVIYRTSP